jgi:hypothetical protein
MGILIDALASKYAAQSPPLEVAAGIRQQSELDPQSNLALADTDEMDAFINEKLSAREKEALGELGTAAMAGGYAWPFASQYWPLLMPGLDSDQRAAVLDNQTATAAESVEKYVLGDLFFKASHRNPEMFVNKYLQLLGDKSTGRKGEADLTLQKVKDSINGLLDNLGVGAGKSNVLKTAQMARKFAGSAEYSPRGENGEVISRNLDIHPSYG